MAMNKRKGLRDFLASRAKRQSSKDAPESQPLLTLSPPPPHVVNPFVVANLQKKRKEKDVSEEGEVVLQKDLKKQKMAKG